MHDNSMPLWIGPCPSGANLKPPRKRHLNRWQKVEIHHVECIEDFAGNGSQPGFWADLWQTKDGDQYILFGGFWEYFSWCRGPATRPAFHHIPRAVSLHKHPTFAKKDGKGNWSFDWRRFRPKGVELPPKPIERFWRDKDQLKARLPVEPDTFGHPQAIWATVPPAQHKELNALVTKKDGWILIPIKSGILSFRELRTSWANPSRFEVQKNEKPWFITYSYSMLLRLIQMLAVRPTHDPKPAKKTKTRSKVS